MIDGLRFSLWHLLAVMAIVAAVPALRRRHTDVARAAWLLVGIGAVACLPQTAWIVGLTVWSPNFVTTESEVGLEVASVLFNRGLPLYPDPSGNAVYGLLYGPYAFLPYSLAFKLAPSVLAAKAMGFALAIWALAALGRLAFEEQRHRALMALALGSLVTILGPTLPLVFNPKGDALLLLAAAVPWLARERKSFWILAAVGAGIGIGIRLTAVVAFLPHLWFGISMRGWRIPKVGGGVLIALGAAGLPFLHPSISLSSYLEYLQAAAHHGFVPIGFIINALLAIPGALAFCLFRRTLERERKAAALGVVVLLACVLTLPAASKWGSGIYHFWPLVPSWIVWVRSCLDAMTPDEAPRRIRSAWIVACAVIAGSVLTFVLAESGRNWNFAQYYKAERPRFLASLQSMPKNFALVSGASEQYGDWDFRADNHLVDAVLYGAEVPVSSFAQLDLWGAGLPLPSAVVERIASCEIAYFLGYRDQVPWQTKALYAEAIKPGADLSDPAVNIYGADLTRRFLAAYEPVASAGDYRVWQCRTVRENR